MLGDGGGLELMRKADKHEGRAVVQSMLGKMLRFWQQDHHSAGTARPIGKNKVSNDSPGRKDPSRG